MREILFRGKRIRDGSWVYGGIMKTFHPNFDHESPEAFNLRKENCYCICANGKDYFVEQDSIGQYTGLTDKNGKKIFEGDIVKGKDALEKNLEVHGYIDHQNGSFVIVGDFMTHYRWLDYDVEVIGNIHDNKLEDFENGC